jgi:hypothetical protein
MEHALGNYGRHVNKEDTGEAQSRFGQEYLEHIESKINSMK